MPKSINGQMGLSIFLISVLIIASFLVIFLFKINQKNNDLALKIIIKNDEILEKVIGYEKYIFTNHYEYKNEFKKNLKEFKKNFYILKNGGEYNGQYFLPTASEKIKIALLGVERNIVEYEKLFESIGNEAGQQKDVLFIQNNSDNYINSSVLLSGSTVVLNEYLKILNNNRHILFLRFFVIITIGFFVILIVSFIKWRIAESIKKLYDGVKIISTGNLLYKVSMDGEDEISILSREFDKMTTFLQYARQEKKKAFAKVKKMLNSTLEINAKQDAILDSIGEGLLVLDRRENIMLMNKTAKKMLKFSGYEFTKKWNELIKIYDFSDKTHKKPIIGTFKDIFFKNRDQHIYMFQRFDGTKFPARVNVSRIRKEGKKIGYILVFIDFSREQEIDKSKTEFVSVASHQLRSPIASINWYAELLSGAESGYLNKKQKKYLSEIIKSSKRMSTLVKCLLNVSRIELGTFVINIKKINLKILVDDVLDELKFQIKEKNLTIKKDFDLDIDSVQNDQNALRIILQNLINNAIKYTPENGLVNIKFNKKDNDNILFTISDTGIGIPLKEQEHIFKKMFRTERAKKIEVDGSGLGLYIVKMIVKKIQGKIWFKSPVFKKDEKHDFDYGTVFYCEIPIIVKQP